MTLRIAIAGASGYAGGEVARLIAAHPEFELGALTAQRNEGRAVRDVHPHLASAGNRVFQATTVSELAGHDVVVLALPHGESGALGEELSAANPSLVLVDLGADRRLESPTDWGRFYGGAHHAPWVYGIPELPLADGSSQRSHLEGANRIVAPGCNASAVSIALAPLLRHQLIEPDSLVATLAVGTSGAGRSLREDLLASERLGSASAYAIAGSHRHTPEVIQTLGKSAGDSAPITVSLTPVLVPMSRGILAVNQARVRPGVSKEHLLEALLSSYGQEAFIQLTDTPPSTGSVVGSNTVALHLAFDPDTHRVSVISAIDNLVKGTAGAAIQSLNVALGFGETIALPVDGVAP